MFDGVPLYPVEMIRRSRTTIAPTRLPRQSARRRTASAIPMKYAGGSIRSLVMWSALVRRGRTGAVPAALGGHHSRCRGARQSAGPTDLARRRHPADDPVHSRDAFLPAGAPSVGFPEPLAHGTDVAAWKSPPPSLLTPEKGTGGRAPTAYEPERCESVRELLRQPAAVAGVGRGVSSVQDPSPARIARAREEGVSVDGFARFPRTGHPRHAGAVVDPGRVPGGGGDRGKPRVSR